VAQLLVLVLVLVLVVAQKIKPLRRQHRLRLVLNGEQVHPVMQTLLAPAQPPQSDQSSQLPLAQVLLTKWNATPNPA